MTAKEARELTERNCTADINEYIRYIKDASKEGCFMITFEGSMSDKQRKKLINLGYAVKRSPISKEKQIISISW